MVEQPSAPLVTSEEAVVYLRLYLGVEVKEVTIRQWAHRGHVQAWKSFRSRRGLYDLTHIDRHARKTLLAKPDDLL